MEPTPPSPSADPSKKKPKVKQYDGESPADAGKILDKSEGQRSHQQESTGHARGHASHSEPDKPSVEYYSKKTEDCKTGFLSRDDQDNALHCALQTDIVKNAINKLNKTFEQTIKIPVEELMKKSYKMSKGKGWGKDGKMQGDERDIEMVHLVLRHHENKGKYGAEDEHPLVHTFFPMFAKTEKEEGQPLTCIETRELARERKRERIREKKKELKSGLPSQTKT